MNINSLSFLSLCIFLTACSSFSPEHQETILSPTSAAIRVATYNVFSGTHDSPATAKAIRKLDADLLALQELSTEGAKQLNQQLRLDYPYRHFAKGMAILSRYPISNERFEKSQHGINGFLFGEVQLPKAKIQFASLHLDPLRLWTSKDRQSLLWQLMWGQNKIHRDEIDQILKSLNPKLPTILAGDFNSASGSPIRQLEHHGFIDSFAQIHRHPDQTHTLRFKLFGIPTGRRIDFILHDSDFRTLDSQVLPAAPSDHHAVLSVLDWAP